MQVYHEILPRTYRLFLIQDLDRQPGLPLLQEALRRAARSGKRLVWIDCRLPRLDMATLRLLAHYRKRLRAMGVRFRIRHAPATNIPS
jgi:anti-anti-sigma regulatory factor